MSLVKRTADSLSLLATNLVPVFQTLVTCSRLSFEFYTLNQWCTTQISWLAEFLFGPQPRAKLKSFYPLKGCIHQENKLKSKKKLDLAGHIKSSRGPHLARGTHVVHACLKLSHYSQSFTNLNYSLTNFNFNLNYSFTNFYFSLN